MLNISIYIKFDVKIFQNRERHLVKTRKGKQFQWYCTRRILSWRV